MNPRFRGDIRVIALLICLTILKMGGWTVLHLAGKASAFAGSNAVDLYIPIANRMVVEHRFNGPDSRPASKVPPAYSLVVAAMMTISQSSYLRLLVELQMLADLGTALILYWLALRIGRPEVGIAAACAWLLYPPAVICSTWVTAETFFTLLFTLGLALLALSFEESNQKLALVGGLVMGVATLFRGTPLFLPLLLLPAALWVRALWRWTLFTLAMAVVIVPWSIRNFVVLDDVIPVAVGTGSVVMQGSDERFFTGEGKSTYYPSTFREAAVEGIHEPDTDRESKLDEWMGRVGFWVQRKRLEERPLSMVPFLAHKFVRVWYGTESAHFKQQAALAFLALLFVPAGAWQLWKWRAEHRGLGYVFLCALAYIVLMHVATLPEARYTFPIVPVLLLAACQRYLDLAKMA